MVAGDKTGPRVTAGSGRFPGRALQVISGGFIHHHLLALRMEMFDANRHDERPAVTDAGSRQFVMLRG